jgi:hypothetical protein
MRSKKTLLPALALLLFTYRPASAADAAPSFTRDVKPFLEKYCVECHNDVKTKSGYNLETYAGLFKGGKKGRAVVAGDPDKSLLFRTLTGKAKIMPPKKYSDQPKKAEIAMIRAWIKAGAKDDTRTRSAAPRADDRRLAAVRPQRRATGAAFSQELGTLFPRRNDILAE